MKMFVLKLHSRLESGLVGLASYKHKEQGNLLRGIDNKTARRQGISGLHPLFTYALFSVKNMRKMVQNGSFLI